jgi:hypothetical protein
LESATEGSMRNVDFLFLLHSRFFSALSSSEKRSRHSFFGLLQE